MSAPASTSRSSRLRALARSLVSKGGRVVAAGRLLGVQLHQEVRWRTLYARSGRPTATPAVRWRRCACAEIRSERVSLRVRTGRSSLPRARSRRAKPSVVTTSPSGSRSPRWISSAARKCSAADPSRLPLRGPAEFDERERLTARGSNAAKQVERRTGVSLRCPQISGVVGQARHEEEHRGWPVRCCRVRNSDRAVFADRARAGDDHRHTGRVQ